MRALLSICAASAILIASPGSAWAGSTLLSGTVTCALGGANHFVLTGGSFAINANGSLTFKMTGLPANLSYGCTLVCSGVDVVHLPNCGSTNTVGKTAINIPAFLPPATLCPFAAVEFGFEGTAGCLSGFGLGTFPAADDD
jgi:hypothetical protein